MDVALQAALRNLRKDPLNPVSWDQLVSIAFRNNLWVWVTGLDDDGFLPPRPQQGSGFIHGGTIVENRGALEVHNPDTDISYVIRISDVETVSLVPIRSIQEHRPIRNPSDKNWRELQRRYEATHDPELLKKIEDLASRKGRKFDLARRYLAQLKRQERIGPIIIEHAQLVELLGLPAWSKLAEDNIDHFMDAANASVGSHDDEVEEDDEDDPKLSEGYGERQTKQQKLWDEVYQEAEKEAYNKWSGVVDRIIEIYCGYHHINVKDFGGGKVILTPTENWTDTAAQIVRTINGVGSFTYESVSEFVRIGPYSSPRHAVEQHLQWIKDYGAVYGERSPSSLYDNLMR